MLQSFVNLDSKLCKKLIRKCHSLLLIFRFSLFGHIKLNSLQSTYPHNYFNFNFYVCILYRRPPSVQRLAPISVSVSQNVTNKNCLIHSNSDKCEFGVTLRPLGSMRHSGQPRGINLYQIETF